MVLETTSPKENIRFQPFHSLASANWSSGNDTMLGALAHGMIDTVTYNLVLTTERAKWISFATPFSYEKLCFYTRRIESASVVDNSWYFMDPFSSDLWIFSIIYSIVVLMVMQRLSKARSIRSLPNFNRTMTALETSIMVILMIYSIP
jgi:hypothetical protein